MHWVFVAVHGFSLVTAKGAALSCGAQASHCSGFSCCGAPAIGRVGFSSCSMQALVVVAHELSCFVACGIFLDQKSNLCPLHWQADSYPLYHQGGSLRCF